MTLTLQWLLNFAIGYATPYLVDPGAGKANLGSNVFYIWYGRISAESVDGADDKRSTPGEVAVCSVSSSSSSA